MRWAGPALGGAAALVLSCAGSVAVPAAAAAQPAAAAAQPAAVAVQAGGDDLPISTLVTDIRPRAPRPGDDLQVLGTLRNEGDEPLTDLRVRVRVGDRLSTRAQLAEADQEPPEYRLRDEQPLPDLAAGVPGTLDVRLPVEQLRLAAIGVYPLQIEVRGRQGDREIEQLGAVSTFVPWFPDAQLDPLRVAWLWPLVDQPRRGPREVMLDDELAVSLAPGGRLERSLRAARMGEQPSCPTEPAPPAGDAAVPMPAAAGATERLRCDPVPVTYAVDPELLYSVAAMTRPYDVADGPERTRPGAGVPAASSWLQGEQGLVGAVAAGDVLALPFADPDVVALTRRAAGLADDVATARTYGETVARDVLGSEPLEDVAFPPPGRLTDAALDAVAGGSTSTVVLEPDALDAPGRTVPRTPGARVGLPRSATSGPLTGLVVDRELSELLVPDGGDGRGPRLAEQRWLVETAMIAAERPNDGRTLLVAPPRRADLDPALAGAALADTGRLPWMCGVRLVDVVAGIETCTTGTGTGTGTSEGAETIREATLAQPGPETPEISPAALAQVREVRADAAQFTGAVVKGGTEQAQASRTRMQRAWLRAESSAWRVDGSGGARLTGLLRNDVDDLRGRVKLLTGDVTLTSNSGRVSVALVNELDQPVTVAVRLQAPSEARLASRGTDLTEVPPRQSLQVEFDAETQSSGRFLVQAQLVDRDGQAFGQPQALLVRSTRYGAVALGLTGLGTAVLLVAAGTRIARRALQRG